MKLISCYIEKFGGLSKYALDFSDGVTVLEEPNGFGKTTLAEFLRAMFYGFPRKAKTLDKSKRQKYTPWDGGKFGGNLVFELDGIRYRLERTFGATPRSDSFQVIDLTTGRKSDRFSEEIGLELFQLDADSFERSTYLPQNQEGLSLTTAGIQAKLTDLVEDTNDLGNYDKAIVALKTARSAFVPYRGSGGSVAEAAGRVSALQQELNLVEKQKIQLQSVEAEIRELEERIDRDKVQLEQIRQQWQQASEWAALRNQYEDCKARYDAARATALHLDAAYPMGIPGDEELAEARKTAEMLTALEDTDLTPQERQQYEKLRAAREAGLLDERRLETLAEQNRELLRQRAALENMTVAEEDRQQMARFNGIFEFGIPSQEQLDNCRDLLRRCETLRTENTRLAQSEKKPFFWLVILGLVLVLVGFMLVPHGTLRSILLPFGGSFIGTGLVFTAKTDRHNRALREEREQNEAAIVEYEKKVADFARPMSQVADLYGALEEIQRNMTAAASLQEKLRLQQEKREAQARTVELLEAELHSQLGAGDFDKALSSLYLAREKLNQWDTQECRRRERLGEYHGKLDRFFTRFELPRREDVCQLLQRIYDDGRELKLAQHQEQELAEQMQQFPRIPEDGEDPDSLKQLLQKQERDLEELTEKLFGQRQRCTELRRDADRILAIRDDLEAWQEKRLGDQKKADTLDATMDYLAKARDRLTTSYLGPIRESFARYIEKLTKLTGETVFITPELDVQLERQGQARELGYFSAGQTDIVMLCMRLALVDALFEGEKPFVILDDPFVNLDDEHTAQALNLLKELGRDRQIIYLTCNSSRSM